MSESSFTSVSPVNETQDNALDPMGDGGRPSSAGSEWDDGLAQDAWDDALKAAEEAQQAEAAAEMAEKALADFPDSEYPVER